MTMVLRGSRAKRGLVLAWVLWGGAALAQEAAAPDTGYTNELELLAFDTSLEAQVASASKLAQSSAEAPGVVSVLSRDQIRAFGWLSLNGLVQSQPGFIRARDYDREVIAARGGFESWNNNHLLLLIDGVPYNDNLYGSAYTSELTPLYFAQSVEVLRGPGSSLYGSMATSGVLSLNTVSAGAEGSSSAEARMLLGNYNTRMVDVLATHAGRRFATVLAFNLYGTQGNTYRDVDGSGRTDAAGNLEQFTIGDHRRSNYFFAKVDGRDTLRGFQLQFHNQAWDFQTGHGWLWWAPDLRESMQESRQMVSLRYRTPGAARLTQEYVLRLQRHNLDWRVQYFPTSAAYPAGAFEDLRTAADEAFARAQLTYALGEGALLGGVEDTLFVYRGDDGHSANFDLATGAPTADIQRLGPWFEWVDRRPVNNLGLFAQYSTGRVLDRRVSLTAGARYDTQFFRYTDILDPLRPTQSKSYQQLSPKLALVVFPSESFTLKGLAGRAFRAPAPAELFGANTYTLASNLAQLRPEVVTSYELVAAWRVSEAVHWRTTGYHRRFENQIAYSVSNANLSTNLFSQTTAGVETELGVSGSAGSAGRWTGYLNYAYAHLLGERIQDPLIAPSPDRLTWAPAHVGNAGLSWSVGGLIASARLHAQGPTARRPSDRANPTFAAARPATLPGWATVDARGTYRVVEWANVGLQVENAFDSRGQLIKNNDYPFDYRITGRRVFASLELTLD